MNRTSSSTNKKSLGRRNKTISGCTPPISRGLSAAETIVDSLKEVTLGSHARTEAITAISQVIDQEVTRLEEASPNDLRALGWSVAIHNDYRLNNRSYTFWLFTKDGRAVKGEGPTDADALDHVRLAIAASAGHATQSSLASEECPPIHLQPTRDDRGHTTGWEAIQQHTRRFWAPSLSQLNKQIQAIQHAELIVEEH